MLYSYGVLLRDITSVVRMVNASQLTWDFPGLPDSLVSWGISHSCPKWLVTLPVILNTQKNKTNKQTKKVYFALLEKKN